MGVNVPENCLCCGAKWIQGNERPGQPMKMGLRVFYECGASVSLLETQCIPCMGIYYLLITGCQNEG